MRTVELDERSMENILADMLKRDPNNYNSYTPVSYTHLTLPTKLEV